MVAGTVQITNGDKEYLLTENQSTYIPLGVVHSLANPGKLPLELIEIQSGSYLGKTILSALKTATGALDRADTSSQHMRHRKNSH